MFLKVIDIYHICSIECPECSFNFGTLWGGGANSNEGLFREGMLIKYFFQQEKLLLEKYI